MTVDVILTCYNEGPYIAAAVNSVFAQTAADRIARVVVADDGSDANTLAVLRALEGRDPRLEIIYGSGGGGVSAGRNTAAGRCGSEYLSMLDGDDLWLPEKLERQLEFFGRNPDVGLLYTNYIGFWDDDISAGRVGGVRDITDAHDLLRTYFLNDPPIMPSTVLIRRQVFDAIGGFDPKIRVFEDTDFFIRAARICRFGLVDAPLIQKRNRRSSITGKRHELMAHHAFVAFRAAERDPRLTSLVPKRLAERARKLGNLEFYEGEVESAARFYDLARKMDATSPLAWASWLLARVGGRSAYRLLKPAISSRAAVLGRPS